MTNKIRQLLLMLLSVVIGLLLGAGSLANESPAKLTGRLIGEPATINSSFGETIYTLAEKQLVGAGALANANPDIDPLIPGDGIPVRLPTLQILPDVAHEGIVVNLPEMRLYYFPPDGTAVQIYPVGIGRQGWDTPVLEEKISSITRHPVWTPPESIHQAYRKAGLQLAKKVPAGPNNPLGKYALRLGQTSYLIHGTNKPRGVGLRVSHGCIRLYPQHIEHLAASIKINTPVRIINQPFKLARKDGSIFLEAHRPILSDAYDHSLVYGEFMKLAEASLTPLELFRLKRLMGKAFRNGDLFTGYPMVLPE